MRTRFLVAFVILIAVGLLYRFMQTPNAEQREKEMLQRVQDFVARQGSVKPVVFLGDSLVEHANFSPTICGRPVINAGYSGAVATGVLRLVEALDRIRFAPAVLVISVGVNDSIVVDRRPFAETYPDVVQRATALGGKVFLVSLAPVAKSGSLADEVDRSRFAQIDRVIRQTTRDRAITLIDVGTLRTQASPLVADGVHLSQEGYAAWTSTIEAALNGQCP